MFALIALFAIPATPADDASVALKMDQPDTRISLKLGDPTVDRVALKIGVPTQRLALKIGNVDGIKLGETA